MSKQKAKADVLCEVAEIFTGWNLYLPEQNGGILLRTHGLEIHIGAPNDELMACLTVKFYGRLIHRGSICCFDSESLRASVEKELREARTTINGAMRPMSLSIEIANSRTKEAGGET